MAKKAKVIKIPEKQSKKKTKEEPKGKSTIITKATTPEILSPLVTFYVNRLNAIDKKLKLRAGQEFHVDPISTGLLCVDYVLSGGMRTAFNQVSGPEQSGKTTEQISLFGQCVKANVPLIAYTDAEGSMDPMYSDAVLNSFGLSDVFDQISRRYYSTNVLEKAIRQLATLAKYMPDKLWVDDAESWCYVVPKGQPKWTTVLDGLKAAGLKAPKSLQTDTDWVYPTEYTGPEAAFFIDSWPALIPESVDEIEDGDGGAGLGAAARVFSAELPKFAGRLKRKGIMLSSVNQMREKPMAQGNPWYEPGGNALRLFTTVRNQMMSRAVSTFQGFDADPDAGNLCIEESVSGEGYDRYAFKSFTNTKNKLGRPFLKTFVRVWTSDENGDAKGFDPVFDCFYFMKMTGQLTGTPKKGMTIKLRSNVKGVVTQLNGMTFKWHQFKELVLAEYFQDTKAYKAACDSLGINKRPFLRAALFQQLKDDKELWGDVSSNDDDEEENDDD